MESNCLFEDKKKFINRIYLENWTFSSKKQAFENKYYLDVISSKIYTDSSRFLIELIQNFPYWDT